MSKRKVVKVTIETDEEIMTIEGIDAERWDKYCIDLSLFADAHDMNPFDKNPIIWKVELR